MPAPEFIFIVHPNVANPAPVPPLSFPGYQARGWQLANPDDAQWVTPPPSPPAVDVVTVDELQDPESPASLVLADSFARVLDGELIGPNGEPIEVGTANILLSDERPVNPPVGLVRIGLPVEDPNPEPEPGILVLADTFNRADAGEPGNPQVGPAPVYENAWIRDGALVFPTAGGRCQWDIDVNAAVIVIDLADPDAPFGGIDWHFVDDGNRYFANLGDGGVGKIVGGTYTPLGSAGSFAGTQVIKIVTTALGVHTIYRDDVEVHTFTDTGVPSGGVKTSGGGSSLPGLTAISVTSS